MTRFWRSAVGLFCLCCCSSLKSDNLHFFSRPYRTDKEYAKNIEIKAYLVTRDQLINGLADDNFEIVQKTNRELYLREVFLLIRCKNVGDYRAFGTLNCRFQNRDEPFSLEVGMIPGSMTSFSNTAINRMTDGIFPHNNDTPITTCEWKHLYTM